MSNVAFSISFIITEAAQSASLFFMYLGLGGFVVYLSCEYINRVVPSLTLLQISFLCFAAGKSLSSIIYQTRFLNRHSERDLIVFLPGMFLNVNFGTLQFGPENDDDDTSEEPSTDTLYPTMPKWKFILANALMYGAFHPLTPSFHSLFLFVVPFLSFFLCHDFLLIVASIDGASPRHCLKQC